MERLMIDYRRSLLALLSMPVLESAGQIGHATVGANQGEEVTDATIPRVEAIAQANTSRILAAIEDSDAIAVLDRLND